MAENRPSAYAVMRALTAWHDLRAKLIEQDSDLVSEAGLLNQAMATVEDIVAAMVRSGRQDQRMAESIKQERDALAQRQARFERRYQQTRETIAGVLETAVEPGRDGKRKLVLPIATLSLTPRGQSVTITDEAKIPDRFVTKEVVTIRRVNKDALLAAMTTERIDEETGEVSPPEQIEGAVLSNAAPQLRIDQR